MSATTNPPGSNIAPMPKRTHHAPLNKNTSLSDAFDHPEFMSRIKQAIPRHMTPERMLSVFIQAVKKTPKLREVDTLSLLGAFVSVASVGLEPNTALQHAHIIPFEKNKWNPTTREREKVGVEVNIIFGYQGLLELVYRSGLLRSVHADVIWADEDNPDHFRFHYGSGSELFHKPIGGEHQPGEMPVWAYTHANMKGDAEMFEVMPMSSILRIRDASQGYQSAMHWIDEANKKKKKPPVSSLETPWIKHFIPMAKKTAFRAAAKWLPKSIELASAISLDEAQERGRIPYGNVIEGKASVLDGSLEALTDEYTDREDMTFDTGFSTQESRQTVDVGSGMPTNTETRKDSSTASQSSASTTTRTTPAAGTGFAAYLTDQWGELVQDDEFTDAINYARALVATSEKADDISTLLEMNAPGIEDACRANSVARSIIGKISAPAKPATPVQVPEGRGGALAWIPYVKAAKDDLSQVPAAGLEAWATLNLPTILRAPDPQRLLIIKAVSDHAAKVGAQVPASIAAAVVKPATTSSTAAAAKDDPDDKWAESTIAELAKQMTEDDVVAMANNGAIRSKLAGYKTSRPDLFKRVDEAFRDRITEVSERSSEPEDDMGIQDGDPGFSG
jgi:recombination protein RecT